MSRSQDLARQAIARHQIRGEPLEAAIAWAIRRALDEHNDQDRLSPMPPAAAAVVALLEDHGSMSPTQIAVRRGTTREASCQILWKLLAGAVVRRIGHGRYALTTKWRAAAAAYVNRWHAGLSATGRKNMAALKARQRAEAARRSA